MRSFCLLLLLFIITSCDSNEDRQNRSPDELIRLSDAESRGLDPQLVSDLASIRIAADQFEGLTRFDGRGDAIPGLAESWAVSKDGLTWTFKLRPNLLFSDGAQIDAKVFGKALNRIRKKSSGSPHEALFAVIAAIDVPNSRQVVVQLHNPFPQLPALLAHPAIAALPFHLIETQGEAWTAARPLVTSGPYRLMDWSLNQSVQLASNPNWHAGKPATSKIKWQPMDNKQSGMRMMLSGAADVSSDFPDNRFEWLKANHPSLVHSNAFLATYYFAFNTRRPPFNDVRVRRALAMTADRQWMASKMITTGNEPAWGLLPPGIAPGQANAPEWKSWTKQQRTREARRLLSAAGYGPNKPLTFEIRFNNSSEHRRAAVVLATMWRDLGVQARLLNSEASLHFDSLKRGDFALARSGWVADLPAPENFLAVHRSDSGPQNYSGYANAAFDSSLNAAMAEPDIALRVVKMRQAESILLEDLPILPLYFYVTKAMVQPNVSGWQDNIANVHPSYTLAKTEQ